MNWYLSKWKCFALFVKKDIKYLSKVVLWVGIFHQMIVISGIKIKIWYPEVDDKQTKKYLLLKEWKHTMNVIKVKQAEQYKFIIIFISIFTGTYKRENNGVICALWAWFIAWNSE